MSSRDLSLETPLVRVLAKRVGLGEPASLLQEATSAAVAEAGKRHLTRSSLSQVFSMFFVLGKLQ